MLRRVLTSTVLLLATLLAINTWVALGWLQPVEVAGDSMLPTLASGERIVVRRWCEPRRWDVVVLRSPTDASRLIVKRVLGLPGEEIRLAEGQVWINGQVRNPPAGIDVYWGAFGSPTWQLGDQEWFVAGDNQAISVDSRNWNHAAGVPGRLIVGVVAR